ncbi:LVIVD repeat-containing protein [Candidatus Lokiarchaeum ossiferum]|uniref:LVIVD repeat-containing protein n=1 Tax=Candidatus Lokiarchaeum ossiferum TaxID=2951803 RepID=UPI00352F830E
MAKKKKKKIMYKVKTKEKVADIEKKKEITKEEKFYWVRVAVAAVSALLGVLVFKLVGWWMFLYMMLLLLGWPFIQSFLIFKLPYQKDKWDWKQILKTGIGGHFFTFMFISTICFTLVSYPAWDDQLSNPADTYDIQIEGNMAYIADGTNGFVILDITNPNHRELMSSYKIDGLNAQKIFVADDIGYLADSNNSILLFDLSDETNPILLSKYQYSNSIASISVQGNLAYVAIGNEGLSILDVSTPSNPSQVGKIDGSISDVVVINNTAYLTDFNEGLKIVNVSDATHPIIMSTLNLEGQMMDLEISDSIIFIAAGEKGMHIVNSSVLDSPQLLGSYNSTANASSIVVNGESAYLSNGEQGISFIDISDLSNPVNITDDKLYNTIGPAYDLAIYNDYLVVADGTKGLTLIYLPEPAAEPDEIVATANKTIPFGWTWGIISLITVTSLVSVIKKREN